MKRRQLSFGAAGVFGVACAVVSACVPDARVNGGSSPIDPPIAGSGGSAGAVGGIGVGGDSVPPGFAGSTGSPALTGPVVSSDVPPPPIAGGTLLVLSDGKTAFAADPDRDALFLADLVGERLLGTIALPAGDEPGRALEDANGRVMVLLRRGGAIAVVDPKTATVVDRKTVCAAPRGLAYDTPSKLTYVACAGGEVVTLAPDTLLPMQTWKLARDLRDVVIVGDRLFVSQFRSANALVVSRTTGELVETRVAPGSAAAQGPPEPGRGTLPPGAAPDPTTGAPPDRAATPDVAWRMRPTTGGAIMLHQEASNSELSTDSGGYSGGPCKGTMAAAMTTFSDAAMSAKTSAQIMFSVLPVDFAPSANGKLIALVSAANGNTGMTPGQQVSVFTADTIDGDQGGGCVFPQPPPDDQVIEFRQPVGQATAVAFDGMNRVIVQTREPARIEILTNLGGSIKLSDVSRADTAHNIFHMATGAGLACASCHPEGGDDGRVWNFTKLGQRRTQNLRGGIMATAPFHWDGDMMDLTHLMDAVFTQRMGGPQTSSDQVTALGKWMDSIPLLPPSPVSDVAAAARGHMLFDDATVGCNKCHTGATLTNNQTVTVGLDHAVQVPGLRGVGARAPYMHTGCAKTLLDRFDPTCGGGDKHGVTSQLTKDQLADLTAYLDTL